MDGSIQKLLLNTRKCSFSNTSFQIISVYFLIGKKKTITKAIMKILITKELNIWFQKKIYFKELPHKLF